MNHIYLDRLRERIQQQTGSPTERDRLALLMALTNKHYHMIPSIGWTEFMLRLSILAGPMTDPRFEETWEWARNLVA